MESFVSKLRNAVSSTVSNVNAVLPGNLLTREFEVSDHICSAGQGLGWKVYAAVKKSTKEEASLFLFEKRQLDKYSRKDREIVIEVLKKGVAQLTRLRHPSILTVQHPLEESRDSLAFATEPVSASLANLLGFHENLPTPVPGAIGDYNFYDVEIKYGLLTLSEGLAFLHNDVKLLHRNLSPESIIISKKGSWKLAGFDFCISPINSNDFPFYFPFLNIVNNPNDFPAMALPNIDYLAPEYITQAGSPEARLSLAADMYSLGAITFALYNKGKPLVPTARSLGMFNTKRIEQIDKLINNNALDCIPDDSRHHVRMLLSSDNVLRPDAHQFNKLAIFEDVLVRTLQYLDALYQWDNLQKSKFYKGLPEIMSQMPLRVKLDRVVPSLAKEFMNPDMVPFVLPNVLIVAEEISNEEFETEILPSLIPVFQMKEPIQISMILMQKMELILTKSKNKPESIRSHILPMMCRTLEVDAQQVQELCLNTIPTVAHLLDYPSMKNSVLPKVKKLCLTTNYLAVRVNCLLCIGKILDHLDKWLVLDEVIPFLNEIPSKEPAVIMASIGIIQMTMTNSKLGLTKEIMATKVVPFLMPLAIENGLTMEQFNTILSLIKEVIRKVEDEHRVKLEQLNSMKEQQSFAVMAYESKPKKPVSQNTIMGGAEGIFDSKTSLALTSGSSSETTVPPQRNLSLQDKERMTREKTLTESLRHSQPLASKSAPITSPVSQPRDLTSSLINANLTNLSFNSTQQPLATQLTMTSPVNQMTVATNGFPLLASNQSLSRPIMLGQPVVGTFQQPTTFNQTVGRPALGNMMPMSTRPQVPSAAVGPPSTGWTQNQTRPPLMMSFSSVATSPRPPSGGVTPLSKSDLEEFLN